MFKNYFKTAWRSLIKNGFFSLINILGLSIGMAACLLLLEYVSFELSYDHFNKNAANIYRVINDRYQNGKLIQHSPLTYSSVSKAMKTDFPEIASYTRVMEAGGKDGSFIFYNGKKFGEEHDLFVENSFLSMFSYPLVAGDARTALAEPNTIVISTSLAKKLFHVNGNDIASVLGKIVSLGDVSHFYKITGVCRDVPGNSHLQFDCLTSYIGLFTGTGWKEADDGTWYLHFRQYIMLRPGTDYKVLDAKFAAFSQRHYHSTGAVEKFYLQPILSVHMHSDLEYDIAVTGNAIVIWGLFIIAVLILIIAWANYINLATAKSMERAKEVGVRKVAGATRYQLVGQFMVESLIINAFSMLIALFLIIILQGAFNTLISHQLSPADLFRKSLGGYSFCALMIVFMLSGIFISGFYPSFVLSSFKPVVVLKGKFISSLKGIVLRKALVIGQFTITVVLIISSFVIYKQMRFVSEQNLGFNMSQMLIIKGPELSKSDSTFLTIQKTFVNEIKQVPGVSGAALSGEVPGDDLFDKLDIQRSDRPGGSHFTVVGNSMTPDFVSLYQIKMLAGRALSYKDYQPNGIRRNIVVLNAAAIKMLGFESPASAVGRQIMYSDTKFTIVGVVADFHQQSLHYPIEPTMFMPGAYPVMPFSIKVDPHNLTATIDAIRQKYNAMFPGNLFNYYFLDEKFNRQYASDQLFGRAFTIFSGLTIFIACLGLLGLSLFTTLQRSKEVGIRKVLGASVSDIVLTLSKDFMRLVLLAILIASPIAWYIMHNWLQNFVTRVNMGWWVFVGSGLLVAIIALITISFQSIKAAIANPVKSLKSE